MPLEKAVNFLGQLRANSFRRRNLFDGRFPQPVHGTKFSQQQVLPVLAHARAIVEDAFADAFLHQELVIRVGKAVGFVANALQQTQCARVRRQHQRQRAAGPINLFILFRESDDRKIVQPEPLQFPARG